MPKIHATLATTDPIVRSILVLRGQRVILDSDLAALYGVNANRLNDAVRRNAERFPEDFMFQLTAEEQAGDSTANTCRTLSRNTA